MATSIPDISAAFERLRSGGVVAFPTETVYGLGADALNEAAVRRVYDLKRRPSINPLIVHVSGPEMAARLVQEWTPDAAALARMFWPGPLTIVVPRAVASAGSVRGATPLIVPDLVTAGGPTIGVRCPDHPVALALLFGLGSPLVGPSANLSGGISPTTAAHVSEAFRAEDVLVLEGGPCRAGIESTVVSLAGSQPRILRPGLIGAGEIAAVIGRPVFEGGTPHDPAAPLASPGLLARHYAPTTRSHLVDAQDIAALLRDPTRADRTIVILSHVPIAAAGPHRVILLPNDAEEYAFHLYASLRDADAQRPDAILIVRPPSADGAWAAILDRLTRATTPT
jgi:L-threonylcarbamoyladenylate synthase